MIKSIKKMNCLSLLFSLSILLLMVALFQGCTPAGNFLDYSPSHYKNPDEPVLPRTDPGYMQYLEKQSMLGSSDDLSAIVSGSGLDWRNPSSAPKWADLIANGSTWLRVHPMTVLTDGHNSALSTFYTPILWSCLHQAGIKSLYIAPTGGSGVIWDTDRSTQSSDNEDIIQMGFASNVGNTDDYKRVAGVALRQGSFIGGDIIPAATGIGPDFFLASRDYRNFSGTYCLVEIPKEMWSILPNVTGEWRTANLSSSTISELSQKNVIPTYMRQDLLPMLQTSGWATTGEVRCTDGNTRRWIYRYFGHFRRPILNWNDPSANARVIVDNSIVRQVGIFGNALTGFKVEPFFGLEASPLGSSANLSSEISTYDYSIALEAAMHIGRQTRSYGGWSWMRDEISMDLIPEFLDLGADFMQDSVTAPGAEHALLTGNTTLLNFMVDEATINGIDFSRLVHSTSGHDGVSYRLPYLKHLVTADNEKSSYADRLIDRTMEELADTAVRPALNIHEKPAVANEVYFNTSAGIAAASMGIFTDIDITEEQKAKIRKGHVLLSFFKSMQPGIFMLSGQDIVGLLPVSQAKFATTSNDWTPKLSILGTFPLLNRSESVRVSPYGLPRGVSLYGPIDVQAHMASSYLNDIGAILSTRKNIGIAEGLFLGRVPSKSSSTTALATRLPNGTTALSICNFANSPVSDSFDLNQMISSENIHYNSAKSEMSDATSLALRNNELHITLPAWGKALIILH